MAMDLKNLSSNWRKLQESLGKSDPAKAAQQQQQQQPSRRKRSATVHSHTSSTSRQDGVKRRKTSASSSSTAATSLAKSNYSSSTRINGSTPRHAQRGLKRRKMSSAGVEVGSTGDGAAALDAGGGRVELHAETASTEEHGVRRQERVNEGLSATAEVGKYIAIDCEMVGVGPNPDSDSVLARASIVNFNGDQVYDSFVRPKEHVTDWRTHVSGVSAKDMARARSFEDVQRDLAGLMEDRILVGHAVRNDLNALLLGHPKRDIRDTSKHPPFRKIAGGSAPRLKVLAAELLGLPIQGSAHSSVEDARATMLLFRRDKEAFEREHAKKWPARTVSDKPPSNGNNGNSKKKKKKKQKKKN